jgi:hypothetical protein
MLSPPRESGNIKDTAFYAINLFSRLTRYLMLILILFIKIFNIAINKFL